MKRSAILTITILIGGMMFFGFYIFYNNFLPESVFEIDPGYVSAIHDRENYLESFDTKWDFIKSIVYTLIIISGFTLLLIYMIQKIKPEHAH